MIISIGILAIVTLVNLILLLIQIRAIRILKEGDKALSDKLQEIIDPERSKNRRLIV